MKPFQSPMHFTWKRTRILFTLLVAAFVLPFNVGAQPEKISPASGNTGMVEIILLCLLVLLILVAAVILFIKSKEVMATLRNNNKGYEKATPKKYLKNLNANLINQFLNYQQKAKRGLKNTTSKSIIPTTLLAATSFFCNDLFAQTDTKSAGSIFSQGGIVITLILILTPILAGIVLMIVKVTKVINRNRYKQDLAEVKHLTEYLKTLPDDEVTEALKKRKAVLDYRLSKNELSGTLAPSDERGIITNVNEHANIRFIAEKRKALKRPNVDPKLSKLIIWFLISATAWLIFGTTIGEYVGIKFVSPDVDHISWLSFGRLRPVHTNAVFWGWSSLAMLGLGYYVVPRVGNVEIHSIKWGWYTLFLINASVVLGTLALMAGINNGGGEYREYIWPVQLLFAIGLVLTLINFLKTIAFRKTKEIYVSNWYIVAAVM
ncbi:MAG: cbb3-type cytochrome c oxidase subunit I, partial [Segetibacter sp.]